MYDLNICHLYPDLLNLYGDRGNIIALTKRAQWRDINISISNISIGDVFDPGKYDIIFLGGGQDYEQEIIQNDLLKNKASGIKEGIEGNRVFLCICGGYQLLGKYYRTSEGTEIELLGVLDLYTIADKKRMIGNIVIECEFLKSETSNGTLVGFENHSGKTYHGPTLKPLGKVLKGFGNNGKDGFEGAIYKNVYCSYLHGSLLPKNPVFTDYLISLAIFRKYGETLLPKTIDNEIENHAHNSMVSKILGNNNKRYNLYL